MFSWYINYDVSKGTFHSVMIFLSLACSGVFILPAVPDKHFYARTVL